MFLYRKILKLIGSFNSYSSPHVLFSLDKYIKENYGKEKQHLNIFEPDEWRPTGRDRLKWKDNVKIYFKDNVA